MQSPEEGPLTNSREALVDSVRVRGGSNSRAFKIAGLTTLGCLLLASQVFTVYLVVNQKQEIHTLQQGSEDLKKQLLVRSSQPQMKMYMPMPGMSLLKGFQNEDETAETSVKNAEYTPPPSVETQMEYLLQDSQLPHFNTSTFLDNLQSLKAQLEESEWKGLESWMRHWLIFQKAQEKPPASETENPAQTQSKCQMEASVKTLGSFRPQCDDTGRYLPMQCWHSTGYCWCVDESGTAAKGSHTRGKLSCQKGTWPGGLSKTLIS